MTKKRKPNEMLIGPLSPVKGTGKHMPVPQYEFEPPSRICNAASKKPLELGNKWADPVRPGADDFRKFRSVGSGC